MAGAFTRLQVSIEGIPYADQGGFAEVMDRFYHFLDVQFGIRPVYPPMPRSAPRPKQPKPLNWRKTLGFHPEVPVSVITQTDIERAFRVLVKKIRPDRIDHNTNNRRRERWERVVKAREMGIKEVTR